MYEIEYGSTVQLVITAHQGTFHHPFHVHGHHFALVKVGYATQNETTGLNIAPNRDVTCDVENGPCKAPRWSDEGPPSLNMSFVALKTTAHIPAWGYAVLRFRADNPGVWLMHCHMSSHQAGGMTVVFLEAPERIAPPPRGFPRCVNFDMSDNEILAYRSFAERRANNPDSEYRFNASRERQRVPQQRIVVPESEGSGEVESGIAEEEPERIEVVEPDEDAEEESDETDEKEEHKKEGNDENGRFPRNGRPILFFFFILSCFFSHSLYCK